MRLSAFGHGGRRVLVGLASVGLLATGVVVGPLGMSSASASPRLNYTPVTPAHLLDTGTGLGTARRGALGAGGVVDVQVAGRAGIPSSGVAAVVLNVTVLAPSRATFVSVYPTGSARPGTWCLSVPAGLTRANQLFAALGAGGKVRVYNSAGASQVRIDVSGWYATGSAYHPLVQRRVLNTVTGLGAAKAPVGAGRSLTLRVTGSGGVPASGVAAVALNLTATALTARTAVSVAPTGSTAPRLANLTVARGEVGTVLAVAKPDAAGRITIVNSAGRTQLVADVQGWFSTGGEFTALTPTRVIDSRTVGVPATTTNQFGLSVAGLAGVPGDAAAAVISVTTVAPTRPTWLAVVSGTRPTAWLLAARAGETVTNIVTVDLRGPGGTSIVTSAGSTHVLVDVQGWIAGPSYGARQAFLMAGTVGQPMSASAWEQGGVKPLSWSVATGSLPPGLTLDSGTGTVSGTPTKGGQFPFTAEVTDALGQAAEVPVVVSIALVVPALAFATGEVGRAYRDARNVQGGTPPFRWSVTSGTLPSGLSLDPVTGVISGTPTAPADVRLSLAVVDANGAVGWNSGPLEVYRHVRRGVFAWGNPVSGSLGDGNASMGASPAQVTGMAGVTAVAAAGQGAFALRSDGTVWAWGPGGVGQLGNGTTPRSAPTPVEVSDLTAVTSLGAAAATAYAVTSDGTVWAWGYGRGGMLGTGTDAPNATRPVRVPGLPRISSVVGGSTAAYALAADGTVWAWGSELAGMLGNGTRSGISAPVQVSGLSGVTAIAAGRASALALTSAGTVWQWGSGTAADGTMSSVPVQVPGLGGITAIASGGSTRYALTSGGTVKAWGSGPNGELGNGSTGNSLVPVDVSGLSGVSSIGASATAGFAVMPDGHLWGWGGNLTGLLGNGLPSWPKQTVPTPAALVPPITTVVSNPASWTVYATGTD